MVLRELERRSALATKASAAATTHHRLRSIGPDDVRTVVLEGEIDISRAEEFARALAAAERRTTELVLDLRAVTLLDSTAINVITDTAHRLAERNGRVTVLTSHPLVRRVLRMMFVDELVDVQPAFTAADDRDGPTVLPL